jgi:chromosome partitioning protein
MARIIAIANRKGGVGKTTTTVSLGAALAARGKRVVLVDLDSQQSLCASVRARPPKPGLADVIFTRVILDIGELQEVLVEVGDMAVAGGYGLEHAEAQLAYYGSGWENALKSVLEPESQFFDFMLLDCSPSLGCLTTIALTAADEVLVPVQTEFLAVKQLAGIMSVVEKIKSKLNPTLEVAGFLPTLFDIRTRHAMEVLMKVSTEADRYGVRLFQPIPRTVRMAEAAASGKPITTYSPQSVASMAYRALAAEIDRQDEPDNVVDLPAVVARFSALAERRQGEMALKRGFASAV